MKLIDINTGLEITGKDVYPEYPHPFFVQWGANVWDPVITADNVEGKIQYIRCQRYYYDKRNNARCANITHDVGENGRIA